MGGEEFLTLGWSGIIVEEVWSSDRIGISNKLTEANPYQNNNDTYMR